MVTASETRQAWDFEQELKRIPNVSHINISPAPLWTGKAWTVHIRTFTRNTETQVSTSMSWIGEGATLEEAQRNAIECETVRFMRYDARDSTTTTGTMEAAVLRME